MDKKFSGKEWFSINEDMEGGPPPAPPAIVQPAKPILPGQGMPGPQGDVKKIDQFELWWQLSVWELRMMARMPGWDKRLGPAGPDFKSVREMFERFLNDFEIDMKDAYKRDSDLLDSLKREFAANWFELPDKHGKYNIKRGDLNKKLPVVREKGPGEVKRVKDIIKSLGGSVGGRM